MTHLPELLAEQQRAAFAAGIDQVALVERMIHQLEYLRLLGLASLTRLASHVAQEEHHSDHGEHLHRAIEAEVAAATAATGGLTAARMGHASQLLATYPAVSSALARGDVSLRHTEVIASAGQIITSSVARAGYEAAVLPLALTMTPTQLRAHARRLAEHHSDQPLDERYAVARQCREVRVTPLDDGMAKLVAVLAAAEAFAIKDRLMRLSREHRKVKNDGGATVDHTIAPVEQDSAPIEQDSTIVEHATAPITAATAITHANTQADLFVQLLLGDHSAGCSPDVLARVTGHVQVAVPVFTLARLSDSRAKAPPYSGPAELEGYGPIDSETARRIAGHASGWDRVLTHPHSGKVLAVDRYRPTKHLKRLLRARDQHCRFPGCVRPAVACDIDHTTPAQLGGPTALENLGHLCRSHHTLKHTTFPKLTGWQVRQAPNGDYHWRAPTGRSYITSPDGSVRFAPVPPPSPPPSPQPTTPKPSRVTEDRASDDEPP